jgi:hypothetical protein
VILRSSECSVSVPRGKTRKTRCFLIFFVSYDLMDFRAYYGLIVIVVIFACPLYLYSDDMNRFHSDFPISVRPEF